MVNQADKEASELLRPFYVDGLAICAPRETIISAVAAKLRKRDEYIKKIEAENDRLSGHLLDGVKNAERIAALEQQVRERDEIIANLEAGPIDPMDEHSPFKKNAERIAALEAEVDKLNEIIASLDSAAHDLTHKSKSPTDNR